MVREARMVIVPILAESVVLFLASLRVLLSDLLMVRPVRE